MSTLVRNLYVLIAHIEISDQYDREETHVVGVFTDPSSIERAKEKYLINAPSKRMGFTVEECMPNKIYC